MRYDFNEYTPEEIEAIAHPIPHAENNFLIMPEYCKRYPDDIRGPEINPAATLNSVINLLNEYDRHTFEYINGDFLMCERIFRMIEEATGVTYKIIFGKWMGFTPYYREDYHMGTFDGEK